MDIKNNAILWTIWIQSKKVLNKQFALFILTGVINTIFGYVLYAVMFWLFENKVIALVVDYAAGILFNFQTYSKIVFNSHDFRKIFKFTFAYVLTFIFNYASLYLFNDVLCINAYMAQLIALMYIPLILFFLLKRYVFV